MCKHCYAFYGKARELESELAEARREIERLRKIVKCEHTTPPDDVADDNSTELAVMLAEARTQVGAAADVILYEHGEVERLRKALVMIRDMPEIDQDDAYRLRACASDALKGGGL